MARRETETKAKAFAYIMDQLAWIGDDLLVDANGGKTPGGYRPAKLAYWSWLFPQIGSDPAKRSRWQANKGPDELLRCVISPKGKTLAGAGETLAGVKRGGLQSDVPASFDLACVLGWRIRDERGPFEELLTSYPHFGERMGRDVIATFVGLLSEDFASSEPYAFDGLQDAISAVVLGGARANDGRLCSWDFGFDRYGSYLVKKHRMGGMREDWYADLVTLLMVAALLGPTDYRADLLIDTPEKYEDTAHSEAEVATCGAAPRMLDLEPRPFLTRVTFDREPPDELDWTMCEEDVANAGTNSQRILAIPLAGKLKVRMARTLPRYSDAGGVVEIPLNCSEASSKAHAELRRTPEGWLVRDLNSTNGTLVVSRDGTRHMLYRKEPNGNCEVALRNGDVICIAPDHRSGRAVSANPAFLFHTVTSVWM